MIVVCGSGIGDFSVFLQTVLTALFCAICPFREVYDVVGHVDVQLCFPDCLLSALSYMIVSSGRPPKATQVATQCSRQNAIIQRMAMCERQASCLLLFSM